MAERCHYCGSEEPDNGPRRFVCVNGQDEFGFLCWSCAEKFVRDEIEKSVSTLRADLKKVINERDYAYYIIHQHAWPEEYKGDMKAAEEEIERLKAALHDKTQS